MRTPPPADPAPVDRRVTTSAKNESPLRLDHGEQPGLQLPVSQGGPGRSQAIRWSVIDFHGLSLKAGSAAGSTPVSSKPCTSGCSTRPTAPPVSPPRPCTRCTSSSAAPSATPLDVDSSLGHSPSPPTHPGYVRSPRSNSTPEAPTSCVCFCGPQLATGCTPPSGWLRSPACAATNCSDSAGTTSTQPPPTLSINHGLIAVAYELPETRGKTRNARRTIDLRPDLRELVASLASIRSTPSTSPSRSTPPAGSSPTAPATHPPARDLASVRTHRPSRRRPGHPSARPPPHPRHLADQGRRPDQGRQRTTRPRHTRIHDGHLSARAARHAGRRRPHLRAAPRSPSTGPPAGRRPG